MTKKIFLEVGRTDYQIKVNFEKRPPLRIITRANIQGVKVKINGRLVGEIKSSQEPVTLEYNGRPLRLVRVEFLSPNPRTYRPRRIRRKIRIEKGRFDYEVRVSFNEYDPGDKVVIKPRCFRRKRGSRRIVVLQGPPKTSYILKGDCNESLARSGKSGRIRISVPKGTWLRVRAIIGGKKSDKTFEVTKVSSPLVVRFSSGGRRCQLVRIRKKIINKVPLEEEEITCLKAVKRGAKNYFSSQLFLARFYCQQRMRPHGQSILRKLGRNPRNRFRPYRAMKMGIEFGRCKAYNDAVRFLKYAEQRANRFATADRKQNKKSLYQSMATIYEQRYYRTKNTIDLTRALKSTQRLSEIIGSGGRGFRNARKDVSRLKAMIAEKGGLD